MLLPMWKPGQLQPGWLWAGCLDPAQRGLSRPTTPGPNPGNGRPELTPIPGLHHSYPQQLLPRGKGQAGLSLKTEQVVQVEGAGVRALVSALSFVH